MKFKFNLQLFATKENENEDDEIEEEEEEEEKPKKKKTSNKNKGELEEVKNMMWEVLDCLKEKKPETEQGKQTIPIPKSPTPAQPPTMEDKVEETVRENPLVKFLKALW